MNTKVLIFLDFASGNDCKLFLLPHQHWNWNKYFFLMVLHVNMLLKWTFLVLEYVFLTDSEYQNSNVGELENNLKLLPNENCAPIGIYNIVHTYVQGRGNKFFSGGVCISKKFLKKLFLLYKSSIPGGSDPPDTPQCLEGLRI